MRGDASLTARLLLRGTGLAGMAAALGGILAVVATTRPWYVVVAEVSMLGDEQRRQVAAMPGVPGTPWGWLAVVAGLGAVVLGVAVALDRPPPRSRMLLVVAAGLLAGGAGMAAALPPELARVAGAEARELTELGERLPTGVGLEMWSGVAAGVWLTMTAAGMIAAAAAAARDA